MESRVLTSWWCPSVCPSVFPFHFAFLLSDFQNSFFVWKVWHERLNFYTFCPSVRPFIRPFVHPSVRYIFHFAFLLSDFQNSFFVWRYDISDLTFILFVRPFMRNNECMEQWMHLELLTIYDFTEELYF